MGWPRRRWLLAGLGLGLSAAAGAALLRHKGQQEAAAQRAAAALEALQDVCIVAPPLPYDAAQGLPMEAPRAVPPDARCPVCGMYPARFPQWAAQLIYDTGDVHFFDSPLSLFQYLTTQDLWAQGRLASRVLAAYVTDTAGGGWVGAQDAAYVVGSSLLGPMRNGNFPAFGAPGAADRFAQERGGRRVQAAALAEHVRTTVPAKPLHAHPA